MKKYLLAVIGFLGMLATVFKYRGDAHKAEAVRQTEKAEQANKILEVTDEQLKAAANRPKNKNELIDRINSDNF